MSVDALVLIVLPVSGYILLGTAIVALRVVPAAAGDGLAAFVFSVAIPLLLFEAIGTLEMPDVSPWPFWSAYFAGVAVALGVGVAVTRRVFGRDARAGVIGGMSASFSNTVMVGIPVVTKAFGDEGLVTILLLISVHFPVMMTISAVLIELGGAADGTGSGPDGARVVRRVGRELARNPIVIGLAAGLLWRATGLPLPEVAGTVISGVAETAIPLALVALGMTLHRFGVRGSVRPALVLSAIKLVVMPLAVAAVAGPVFGLPPLATAVLVVTAACPTGASAYLMGTQFGTGLGIAANTITLTTLGSIPTIAVVLTLLAG